jgi:hypothetical protein
MPLLAGIILSSCPVLVIYKTSIMQDNSRDHPEQIHQGENQNRANSQQGNESNETQQALNQSPIDEDKGAGDISRRDQQEGNMNNGTLGGNFGEDTGDKR